LPQPKVFTPAGAAVLQRLRDDALALFADRLTKIGVCEIDNVRLVLASPELADAFLDAQRLLAADDVAYALTYGPFGDLSLHTRAGHHILIMPTSAQIFVYEGIVDDPLYVQMDMASTVEGLRNGAKDDPYTSIDGRKMLVAVLQRLGPLKRGVHRGRIEAYMTEASYRDQVQKKARILEICWALCGADEDMIALDAEAMIHYASNDGACMMVFTFDATRQRVNETAEYMKI
jgi:hypothetical protein